MKALLKMPDSVMSSTMPDDPADLDPMLVLDALEKQAKAVLKVTYVRIFLLDKPRTRTSESVMCWWLRKELDYDLKETLCKGIGTSDSGVAGMVSVAV